MKWIISVFIICLVSCQNRYSDWKEILEISQNGALISDKYDVITDYKRGVLGAVMMDDLSTLEAYNFEESYLNEYIKIRTLIFENQYQKGLEAIEKISSGELAKEDLSLFKFHLSLLKLSCYRNIVQVDKFKVLLQKLQKGIAPTDELYTYKSALLHYEEAKLFLTTTNYLRSLAALHRGLHLLSFSPAYKLLKEDYDLLKAKILIERDEGQLSKVKSLLKTLLRNTKRKSVKANAIGDLLTISHKTSDSLLGQQMIEKGLESYNSYNQTDRNYFNISSLSYFGETGQIDRALIFLKDHDSEYSFPCDKNTYVYQLYLCMLHLAKGNFTLVKEGLEKIKVPDECYNRLPHLIEYHKNLLYLSLAKEEKMPLEQYNILLTRRSQTKLLYPGDMELHIDDAYALNISKIFKVIYNEYPGTVPKKFHKKILELFDDTRNRQINNSYRKSHLDAPYPDKKIVELDSIIRSGLRKSNDFFNMNDYDEDYYEELYNAFTDRVKIKSDIVQKMLVSYDEEVNLKDIIDRLKAEHTTIVLMVQYKTQIWAIVFDGNQLRLHPYDSTEVDSILYSIQADLEGSTQALSKKIKDLFQPLKLNTSRAIVIPDGSFSFIPFEQEGKIFTTTYSISTLLEDSDTLSTRAANLFSFSNPSTRKQLSPQPIGDLYFDYEECMTISNIIDQNNNFFHGNDFTINKLKLRSNCDILHIASHGLTDTTNRLASHMFARHKGKAIPIYASELFSLKQTPKFVALSICDSGKGKQMSGSGTYSLSRPFLINGSKTVLKTIWKVDDQASSDFMTKFYSNWKSGKSVGLALHNAKNEMKKHDKYSSPYYWAGYVLEGNDRLYLE